MRRGRPKSFGILNATMGSAAPESMASAVSASALNHSEMGKHNVEFVMRDGLRVEIGKGAFATAYLAVNTVTRDEVVVKEVILEKMSDKDRQKANYEVSFLSQFNHPNVIGFLDHFSTQNPHTLHIILEYANRGNLNNHIEEQKKIGPFQRDEILQFFGEIASALDHLHSKKVLHRDLKTANVFLDKNLRIKVGDFGMSRHADDNDNKDAQVGTPYYFAPELCRETRGPYSNKSDIWSAGVILYELAFFEKPFQGKTLKGLLKNIAKADISHQMASRECDPDVRRLILSILVLSECQRPSAARLCKDAVLAQYVSGSDAIHSRRNSVPPSEGKPSPAPAEGGGAKEAAGEADSDSDYTDGADYADDFYDPGDEDGDYFFEEYDPQEEFVYSDDDDE